MLVVPDAGVGSLSSSLVTVWPSTVVAEGVGAPGAPVGPVKPVGPVCPVAPGWPTTGKASPTRPPVQRCPGFHTFTSPPAGGTQVLMLPCGPTNELVAAYAPPPSATNSAVPAMMFAKVKRLRIVRRITDVASSSKIPDLGCNP